jgi:chromate transporter
MALGLLRAGHLGLLCAWIGFTLPSAALMLLLAYGIGTIGDVGATAWLKGLKLVAVAVVAQAVWGMARTLCPDRERASLAVAATIIALAVPSAAGQLAAIVLGAAAGIMLPRAPDDLPQASSAGLAVTLHRATGVAALAACTILLVGLPAIASMMGARWLTLMSAFFRTGALTFGGGHVILPLLQTTVVTPGWVPNDIFLAGYGAAQALPGPLASFAAYLGAVIEPNPHRWLSGLLCVVSIFLPSMLLVSGVMPFLDALRHRRGVQAALRGVNAAVVGLLLAALYTPVWTSTVATAADFTLALTAFLSLAAWAVPPWIVVIAGALAAWLLGAAGVIL